MCGGSEIQIVSWKENVWNCNGKNFQVVAGQQAEFYLVVFIPVVINELIDLLIKLSYCTIRPSVLD